MPSSKLKPSSKSRPNTRPRVILFKTPNPSSDQDPYSLALRPTYDPRFIQVLEETYDTTNLEDIIGDGGERWEGLVVTSRRGAEGWVRAVQAFLDSVKKGKGTAKGKERETESTSGWYQIPLFSVGTAASEYLNKADIAESHKPTNVEPADGPAKSALALARFIIDTPPRYPSGSETDGSPLDPELHDQHFTGKTLQRNGYKPYLFLCGDKALDELPSLLREQGREVEEVVVYRTTARNDIGSQLDRMANDGHSERKAEPGGWLAFFSPSSASYVLPFSRDADQGDRGAGVGSIGYGVRTRKLTERWRGWKVFAIGETTAKYLEEQGIEVDAVAERPSAEGLLESICKADDTDFSS